MAGFFEAPKVTATATVTLDTVRHQDHVLPVVTTPTSEETVPSLDQQPHPQWNSQQQQQAPGTDKDEYFDYTRFTHEFYEYEQGQKNIIVKGRLKKNVEFWKSIGASDFIVDVIENGYKLPLFTLPNRIECKNNRSALNHPDFVSEAIKDLLDRGLIEKCREKPYVVNPLTVSIQNSGKKRLILDLREVNVHLWKQAVKYEDIKVALSYMKKGCFQIKFDLTSAYQFVDIYYPHTIYLGFSWVDKDGSIVFYKFLVLPFGISSACYLFTKLTKPLVKKWRREGKMVTMFLDDGYGCGDSYDNGMRLSQDIKGDLLLSGFIPNATKCIWVPVQILEFLGVMLDSENGIIYIPDRRLNKVIECISAVELSLKEHRRVQVRKLASLIGQLISMSVVIGNVSQIMTRHLSIDVLTAKHWDQFVPVNKESLEQLEFWKSNLQSINSRSVFESHKCSKVVYSDASHTGFAGYEVSTVQGISHGMWSEDESSKPSTWRELVAVYRVLQSLIHMLRHQRVKWYTDNQGVKSIVAKGSMKQELQSIALGIFALCLENSVVLEMEWIPRTQNEIADYLSKIVDYDDWGISSTVLQMIERSLGKLEIDWFASEHNAKFDKFYSRFWNKSCIGVDAFSVCWGDQEGLFVPPIAVLPRVIRKMTVDRARGVIVIPLWESAVFWPMLCPNGIFIRQVVDYIDLPTEKTYYVKSKTNRGLFGTQNLHFRMLALKVDFST